MRRNMKQEFNASMDTLHFSRETKENMVELLMSQTKEIKMERKQHGSKRIFLVALAAVLVMATLTGAAAFTRWSKTAQTDYNPSQEIKTQAEKSGLSAIVETESKENGTVSITSNGITITAVQSIVDKYRAQLIFRIDGFEFPEDQEPSLEFGRIEVDGAPTSYIGGGFYNGVTTDAQGNLVYADGSPMQYNPDGSLKMDYVAADGSLEYELTMNFAEPGQHLGKEITVSFSSLGTAGKATHNPTLEGDWTLRWTLSGTENTFTAKPEAEIGDTGVALMEAEITPITLRAVYKTKGYWDGWETLETFEPRLMGVRLKDGTLYPNLYAGPGQAGYIDQDNLLYEVRFGIDRILDAEQVESLVFLKSWPEDVSVWELTEENFYIVPIQ